jgi:beta-1,4-mannosyltransferase
MKAVSSRVDIKSKIVLKAYLYPLSKIKITNPYFDCFMDHLGDRIEFLNREDLSSIGIMDIFKYLIKIDLVFLNFPEDIIDKRFGIIQFIIFITVIVPFLKITNRRIVWTMHNRRSHYDANYRIKKYLFSLLIKSSDIIIIHSKAGESIIEAQDKKYLTKVFLFPHPVVDMRIPPSEKSSLYDFIIWGAIAPYKGVDAFLKFLHENQVYSKYRILIVGRIKNPELERDILKYLTPNITLIDRFVDDDELKEYILASKTVLFPYNHNSVLSSGALAYSINFKKPIIGPKTAAFLDLAQNGLVYNFEIYDDIFKIDTSEFNVNTFDCYSKQVSWKMFVDSLYQRLTTLF